MANDDNCGVCGRTLAPAEAAYLKNEMIHCEHCYARTGQSPSVGIQVVDACGPFPPKPRKIPKFVGTVDFVPMVRLRLLSHDPLLSQQVTTVVELPPIVEGRAIENIPDEIARWHQAKTGLKLMGIQFLDRYWAPTESLSAIEKAVFFLGSASLWR